MSEWVEHAGGLEDICPINELLWCEVLMLDSEIFGGFAGEFNWKDLGDWGGNIIAYRIPELTDLELKKKQELTDKILSVKAIFGG